MFIYNVQWGVMGFWMFLKLYRNAGPKLKDNMINSQHEWLERIVFV